MLDPAARDKLRQLAQETLAELAAAVLQGGRRAAGRGLRGRPGGQRHHGPPGPRHRPRAARRRAVHHGRPAAARGRARATSASPRTRRPARWSSPRSAPTSAVTSPPGCWPAAWTATRGSGCSSTSAPTARSCSAAGTGCWPPPRRPAPRSRARPSAAACAPPTAPSRRSTITADGDLKLTVIGDTEPARPVRLRPGRRGGRARGGRRHRLLGPVRPGRGCHRIAPGLAGRLTMIGKERVFVLHWSATATRRQRLPVAARHPRAPVRQGGDRHRLAHPARGGRPHHGGRQAGAAGGQLRLLPVAEVRDPDRPGSRRPVPPRSSPRATWRARAPRWPCCPSATAPPPWPSSRR